MNDRIYREAYATEKRLLSRKIPKLELVSPELFLPASFEPEIEQDIFEPQTFEEYIGQERAKELIRIMTGAADKENRPIPSMIVSGAYGLGKTTLAKLILKGRVYQETTGSAANNREKFNGYLLIDEIHNLAPEICDEINKSLDTNKVKIIGCTTNPGLLPGPFRSRFRVIQLTPYRIEDLTQIQYNAINRKGTITAAYPLLEEVSKRGRFTPRRTLQYLAFIMDLMSVKGEGILTNDTIQEAFDKLGVDNLGLTDQDHQYLDALPNDRPVGLQYLMAVLQIDKDSIEQEIEPFLMQSKLIDRTARGRFKIGVLEEDDDEQLEILDEIFKEHHGNEPNAAS